MTIPAHVVDELRYQSGFIGLVVVVALVRLLVPALAGAGPTWAMIGGLWLLGATIAGLTRPRADRRSDLMTTVAVQNLAIQAFVALPGIVGGTWRLLGATEEALGPQHWANAAVTVIALPLLSAIVLSFLALLVASPIRRLRGIA